MTRAAPRRALIEATPRKALPGPKEKAPALDRHRAERAEAEGRMTDDASRPTPAPQTGHEARL